MRTTTKTWIAVALAVCGAAAARAQVRDAPRDVRGTAVLTGTVVTDEAKPQPVRQALVSVTATGNARLQQTSTDAEGRFRIAQLSAGNVRVVVSRPGFVTTYYGATLPGSAVGKAVALTEGSTSTIEVRMARGAVITGAVIDDIGQPMPGVGIFVQRVTTSVLNQRLFAPMTGPLTPATDDRGQFRIFGLPAGDYVVMAQARLPGSGEIRQMAAAEVAWVDRQMRDAGRSGAAASPPPPAERGRRVSYADVYFPGTADAAAAGVITVAAGQERAGVDIRMQFVATARVEGTVTMPDGTPARGLQVLLIPDAGSAPIASLAAEREAVLMELGLAGRNASSTSADGTFSIQGVTPGGYMVTARTGAAGGRGAAGAPPPAEPLWATTPVRVDGHDITGVTLRLAPGQKVSGRIVIDASQTDAAPPARTTIMLRPAAARGSTIAIPAITLDPAGTDFTVTGVIPGEYRLLASPNAGGFKSAIVGGRDIADVPIEIRPGEDLGGLVITLTRSPADLSGVLYDAAGRPSSDLAIVLFSTDRAMWFAGSRRVPPAVRPATDGRYRFVVPAGEYYLAAVSDVTISPADLASPIFLEQVIPAAIKVSIADAERKVQDLRAR